MGWVRLSHREWPRVGRASGKWQMKIDIKGIRLSISEWFLGAWFHSTVGYGLFGAGSGFRVGWRAAGGGSVAVFRGSLRGLGAGRWAYRSIGSGHFPNVSWFPRILGHFSCVGSGQVVRQLVRQLVYTMFISYNRPLFHLWWQGNLVKHRKV